MSGVAHVASIVGSYDPNAAIPGVVAGAINTLESAAKEASVQAFVYTSSSWAAAAPQPNVESSIGPETWNETSLEVAWAPPPYRPERSMDVYAAGKSEAERASWNFVKERKPAFVFNAGMERLFACRYGRGADGAQCCPVRISAPCSTLNIRTFRAPVDCSKICSRASQRSTTSFLHVRRLLLLASCHPHLMLRPLEYAIDTIDCARLHVGALLDPDVENQRLFGYAEPYTWNDILAMFRRMYPDRAFMADLPDQGQDLSTVANERASEVLRKFGRPGFTPLEESVKAATEQILAFVR